MTIERQLRYMRRDFQREYCPKTAFGNPNLIAILRKIIELEEWIQETEECSECGGEGTIDHECNCEHCDTSEVDCSKCDGLGRVEKLTTTS